MPSTGGGWRKIVENLKTAREEYQQYSGMMTAYERSIIERDMKDQAEKYYPMVTAGALGEWNVAINTYKEATREYEREATREITRWDASKLNNELQAIQTLVGLAIAGGEGSAFDGGNPGIAAKLEAIYTEAHQSGDIHKQRATFEVIRTIAPNVTGDDRFVVNRLAKLAEKDLSGLRVTDGMIQAQEVQGKAFNQLQNMKAELIDVAQAIGEGNPTNPMASGVFSRAIRRVQQDRETGEVRIYKEDDWQLAGEYWPQEMKTAE